MIYPRPHQLSLTQGIQQACFTIEDDLNLLKTATQNEGQNSEHLREKVGNGLALVLSVLLGQLEHLPKLVDGSADKVFYLATKTYLMVREAAEDLCPDVSEVLNLLRHPMIDYQIVRGTSLPVDCRQNMQQITHPERVAALATA